MMTSACRNTLVHVFGGHVYALPLALCLLEELLGCRLYACSTLMDDARVLKRLPWSDLSLAVWRAVSPHSHQCVVLSVIQIFIIVWHVGLYLTVVLSCVYLKDSRGWASFHIFFGQLDIFLHEVFESLAHFLLSNLSYYSVFKIYLVYESFWRKNNVYIQNCPGDSWIFTFLNCKINFSFIH